MQADERDALPGALEIEAVMPSGMIEVQIAADDRLDFALARSLRRLPQAREHGFEIEQMRHQRVQIAGQAQFAAA